MSIEILAFGGSRPSRHRRHYPKPSRIQPRHWNTDYVEPVAVLELDHPTAGAGNEIQYSIKENLVRQIHAGGDGTLRFALAQAGLGDSVICV